MSDDLVTPLRNASYLAFEDGTNDYTTPALAAARIAELEAEVKMWRDENFKKQTACEQMGKRIAKLEAALNKINDKDSYPNGGFGPFAEIARAALAGGEDE